ncbi:MAG: hypothetical protein PHN69_03965 [Candidatus Pacebacteria bacterium]|nr:hypothetical protein [Fermentimonas sp.]MDD4804308.1 hypothetical protein [Candidatus Paceibacterota bacterium]
MSDFKPITGKAKDEWELYMAKLEGNFEELQKLGYIIQCCECGSNGIQVFKESCTYAGQKVQYINENIIYSNVQLQHMSGVEYRCANSYCRNKSRNIEKFIKKVT